MDPEENAGSEPEQEPSEGAEPEGGQAAPGKAEENAGSEPEQERGGTVNRHKHERDLGKLQSRIDELTAENERLKSGVSDIDQIKKRLDEFEAKNEADKQESDLKAAGCHDVTAARSRLGEFGGDVGKLKEAAPYLFSSVGSESTGGSPKGKAGDDEDKALDKAFGLN